MSLKLSFPQYLRLRLLGLSLQGIQAKPLGTWWGFLSHTLRALWRFTLTRKRPAQLTLFSLPPRPGAAPDPTPLPPARTSMNSTKINRVRQRRLKYNSQEGLNHGR